MNYLTKQFIEGLHDTATRRTVKQSWREPQILNTNILYMCPTGQVSKLPACVMLQAPPPACRSSARRSRSPRSPLRFYSAPPRRRRPSPLGRSTSVGRPVARAPASRSSSPQSRSSSTSSPSRAGWVGAASQREAEPLELWRGEWQLEFLRETSVLPHLPDPREARNQRRRPYGCASAAEVPPAAGRCCRL